MPNFVTTILRAPKETLDALYNKDGRVDFNTILPIPTGKDMFNKREEAWGTKTNAQHIVRESDNQLSFQTAWCPPDSVIAELSRRFPLEPVTVAYASEDLGSVCGGYSRRNGDLITNASSEKTMGEEAARNFASLVVHALPIHNVDSDAPVSPNYDPIDKVLGKVSL